MRNLIYIGSFLAVTTFAIVSYGILSGSSSGLSVILRCETAVTGKLTIDGAAISLPRSFSMSESCHDGEINFDKFTRNGELLIIYENGTGALIRLEPQQIKDIHSSAQGDYYLILDITNSDPFVSIGSI